MVWFDFEIPQSLIVENSKQRINSNGVCVTNVTFQGDFGVFKQASENRRNEFRSTCDSTDVAMRIYKKQLKIEQLVTFDGPRSCQ